MPKDPRIKKVLVIGSGPIIIGQAAEFDYSGTQACRALKAEGIETVLLNSNPATIMTDPDVADHVYIEPMTLEVVERILDIEKPDSVLPNLGGQMGLNLSMELARSGYLDRTGIRLLACKPETIDRAEDRELFKETMEKLHQPIIPSEVVETLEDALACADRIGYPVIVRPAFTMGGTGGGICENKAKLIEIGTNGLRLSPIHQILVEKCIAGWKEIEYEVMRDHKGNVITVCNMENLDPVGIHTGDSVVVAPSQTLTDHEYQMLRTAALDIITELGIEGGCNCQFALKPDSFDYAVIEVNPRVSRSSALASKATGYPIAKVATKIAIGYTLDEITNDVTGKTCACFEPALDYIVVKYPKWPFDKFVYADKSLGTQMMATGEVMSIGNSFEAAMMELGGNVLGFSSASSSSSTKGESVGDTVKIVSCYADIIAMRHYKEGAPMLASMKSDVPIINAGDGGHNHPTQTLIDMMTIRQRKGRLDHLTIGFCGDLKFGRTVHSLVNSLVRYPDNQFYFISPSELCVPEYLIEDTLKPAKVPYHEIDDLEDTLPKLDVLYMTRVQKERFFNEEDYVRLKGTYMLTKEKLELAPADMPVLHPLPRVDEISLDVDSDKRAAYFQQVQNGVYVRMALIMALLDIPDPVTGEEVLSC